MFGWNSMWELNYMYRTSSRYCGQCINIFFHFMNNSKVWQNYYKRKLNVEKTANMAKINQFIPLKRNKNKNKSSTKYGYNWIKNAWMRLELGHMLLIFLLFIQYSFSLKNKVVSINSAPNFEAHSILNDDY